VSAQDTSLKEPCEEKIQVNPSLADHLRANWLKITAIVVATIILMSEVIFLALAPIPVSENKQIESGPPVIEHIPTEATRWNDCGTSAESAQQRGCHFDFLTISWETPDCYHSDIVFNFLHARDWQFYTDRNGTVVPSWDDVTMGNRRYNVKWDFHFTHCMYVWKMMQTAILEKRPLPDNLLALEHTRHCIGVVKDRRWNWDEKHTLVHVKWPKCSRYGEWDTAHFVE
jgi:hypothetical protein